MERLVGEADSLTSSSWTVAQLRLGVYEDYVTKQCALMDRIERTRWLPPSAHESARKGRKMVLDGLPPFKQTLADIEAKENGREFQN